MTISRNPTTTTLHPPALGLDYYATGSGTDWIPIRKLDEARLLLLKNQKRLNNSFKFRIFLRGPLNKKTSRFRDCSSGHAYNTSGEPQFAAFVVYLYSKFPNGLTATMQNIHFEY